MLCNSFKTHWSIYFKNLFPWLLVVFRYLSNFFFIAILQGKFICRYIQQKSVISNIMIVGDLIFYYFAVKLSLIKFSNQKFRKNSRLCTESIDNIV